MNIPIIDQRIKALIPPLQKEEREQLEANLLRDGCLDALKVWREMGVLIDGHNRLEICLKHGLAFDVVELSFGSLEEVEDWIDRNQLGRRNLLHAARTMILGRIYNRTKKTEHDGGRGESRSGGQNDPHSKTADKLAAEHGVSAATVKRAGKFADAVEKVAKVEPDIVTQVIAGTAPDKADILEAAKVVDTDPQQAKEIIKKKPHVSKNSGNNEWYTPPAYLEAARRVLGTIDLDPASSEVANQFVKAGQFYTADDDGLSKEWSGRVWLNPPYSGDLVGKFIVKLIESEEVEAAIVLVNNATETAWFRKLIDASSVVMFTTGRIKYLDRDGHVANTPLQGQAIVLIGGGGEFDESFVSEFSPFGWVAGLIRV
jgi:ParB family chromosome partitioning protein